MSPPCRSSRTSAGAITVRKMASFMISVKVPLGSPGKKRLGFLPSMGQTKGERGRNAGTSMMGSETTVPRSVAGSRLRVTRMFPSMAGYSAGWTPEISARWGPSCAPRTTVYGQAQSARAGWEKRSLPRRAVPGAGNLMPSSASASSRGKAAGSAIGFHPFQASDERSWRAVSHRAGGRARLVARDRSDLPLGRVSEEDDGE